MTALLFCSVGPESCFNWHTASEPLRRRAKSSEDEEENKITGSPWGVQLERTHPPCSRYGGLSSC